ncbi:AraC family transcriptional regulator [Edaphovirga cremea]|uniref:AraC family transcriptional regulator n=1 Tax=Edaphovirga cremea TaxID=2267246 RepID=UPI000DEEE99B|nr:AraC family transcriptional regulator [Edaphovirga cremea]
MTYAASRKITDSATHYQDFDTSFYEWEDGMSSAGLKLVLPKKNFAEFDWRVTGYNFGKIIGGVLTVCEHDLHRQHGNLFSMPDHILIFIVIIGAMECQCFGRRVLLSQGDILIQDMSLPIKVHVYPGKHPPHRCTYQYMIMPKYAVTNSVDIASLHGHPIPVTSPVNFLVRNHFNAMLQVFDQMTEQEILSTGAGAAAVFMQALQVTAGNIVQQPEILGSKLERICLYIERNLSAPLSVELLCKHFAISRSSLYRLFEPLGGIAHFVRNRRLTLAKRLLRNASVSDLSLSIIAKRCGLELSTLRRHFVETYGATPKELRHIMMAQKMSLVAGEQTHVNWVGAL